MNRCSICDYTEEDGSFLTNRFPSHKIKVQDYHGEHLCDECSGSIEDQLAEFNEYDDEVEGS